MKRKGIFVLIGLAVCTLILSSLAFSAPLSGASLDTDAVTLGIYGNTNEDDCIDMRDYTYTARIICWLEEETDLADANYDGRISVADMTQIGLIILGRESELTIIDAMDSDVTIHKPVNRVVGLDYGADCEVLRALKAKDTVVGVTDLVADRKVFYPELSKVTYIGSWMSPDMEKIIELNPDLVIVPPGAAMFFDLSPLIDMDTTMAYFAGFDGHSPTSLTEAVTKLGYILGKREEAKEFIDFIQDSEAEIAEKVTEFVPGEEGMPKVYMEGARGDYVIVGTTCPYNRFCELAGGINIAADADIQGCVEVDPEWVVSQNPNIIIKMQLAQELDIGGYETDDPSGMKAVRDDIMKRPGLTGVNAVKNGQVYVMYCLALSPGNCVGIPYMAKILHPCLFEDYDHHAIHQQYVTEFQGLDFDVYEHGVWVYPSLE